MSITARINELAPVGQAFTPQIHSGGGDASEVNIN